MHIKIWADFVCPFSYIGKRNLSRAIERLQLQNVEIQYASYLQYPFVTKDMDESLPLYVSNKYGISEQEAWSFMEEVAQMARASDLQFHLEKLRPINTFTAHRLSKLALKYNVQHLFFKTLFEAFFLDGKALDDETVLTELAVSAGLPLEEIQKVFANNALYEEQVERDLIQAQRLGIQGTPYFIINEKVQVAGIQSIEEFEYILKSIVEEQ